MKRFSAALAAALILLSCALPAAAVQVNDVPEDPNVYRDVAYYDDDGTNPVYDYIGHVNYKELSLLFLQFLSLFVFFLLQEF